MARNKNTPTIEELEQQRAAITRQIAEAKKKDEEKKQAAQTERIARLGKEMVKHGVLEKSDEEILKMLGIDSKVIVQKNKKKETPEKPAQQGEESGHQ